RKRRQTDDKSRHYDRRKKTTAGVHCVRIMLVRYIRRYRRAPQRALSRLVATPGKIIGDVRRRGDRMRTPEVLIAFGVKSNPINYGATLSPTARTIR
ncbi:MAG: hypothetical protein ABI949_13700, partial [Ilumatobacteraceae bacterium]